MAAFEQFERGLPLGQEARFLPAELYNATRLLFVHSHKSCVFVPIRSMQYMAVIDAEEIIFVNSHSRRFIEFSWQHFQPQTREDLSQAVPYQFTYYIDSAPQMLARAQMEFAKFVFQMTQRWQDKSLPDTADVLGFTSTEERSA